MSEVVSHTVVALVVLAGGFTMMIISAVTGHPIPDNIMTLITVLMSAVTGWYFGARGAIAGVRAALPPLPAPGIPAEPTAPDHPGA